MAHFNASSTVVQPPDRTRAREKLRSFYNIQTTKPNSASSSQPTKNAPTKTNATQKEINSASFDAKKYLKRLLLEEPISGLLHTDNQLVSEIRQIDGDMKTMVYENYSKFISATETIGRMKEDADFMDAEMEKLARRINTISNRADTVNANFVSRNSAIHRLSSEHQLLQRLQFLFDLPDQLSKHIDRGQFVEAARVWSRTQPLLEHYRQLGVFEGVEKDGKEIMASVEATIWSRWREDPATEISEGAECASLLVLLRPECASMLWREYLEIQSVKHRNLRQVCLESSYEYPVVVGAESSVAEPPLLEPDPSGTPLPAIAASLIPASLGSQEQEQKQQKQQLQEQMDRTQTLPTPSCSRISYFNSHYLPIWNSLVVGFVSQFVSPAGSGLLEQVANTRTEQQKQTIARLQAQSNDGEMDSARQDRTMSLLEATTEGTVVGLLSPLSDAAANTVIGGINATASELSNLRIQNKREQFVVGWQAMSPKELLDAQQVFAEHAKEWCAEYEFIIDSLIQFPGDATATNIKPYLEQLDDLVACINDYPILARIGGLHDCIYRVVTGWHKHLVEGALRAIIRDMIERLEYYFDPAIDSLDTGGPMYSAVSGSGGSSNNPPGLQIGTSRDAAQQPPRRSSASRHQRNASVRSIGSQASAQHHQRPGSVMSGTWPNVGLDRSQQHGDPSTAGNAGPSSTFATQLSATPQSPLLAHQSQNSRGLAHARAVSSAFEALGNSTTPQQPGTVSMSPSLGPFGLVSSGGSNNGGDIASSAINSGGGGGGGNRMSRASIISSSTASRQQQQHNAAQQSTSRPSTLRRTREQRNYSNTFTDMLDDDSSKSIAVAPQPVQSLRRSFSTHRPNVRRYRPWLVNSVNRNAPLHVFLAEMESWLIQQILERVNPLLESVMQHYLDIEGSQMLSNEDECHSAANATGVGQPPHVSEAVRSVENTQRRRPSLQTATRMRQSFIKTLDKCLDVWMNEWIPDSFLYSSLAIPIHGTHRHVEKVLGESPMAQLGMSTVSDPVSSLLLARFAVDFELTLTQSIYQLCEHGISIIPDEPTSATALTTGIARMPGDLSAVSSTEASLSNLLSARSDAAMNEPPTVTGNTTERLHSITASITRADSMASMTSRRNTMAGGAHNKAQNMLSPHSSEHAAKWRSVAERLVKNFVMTVGQDISSDYLKMQPYGSEHQQRGIVCAVSDVWLSICRWMKQVEDDTNMLFYDSVFSSTLKSLEAGHFGHPGGGGYPASSDQHQSSMQAKSAASGFNSANALRLGISGDGNPGGAADGSLSSSSSTLPPGRRHHRRNNQSLHAHILSNIDRLFAERVDVFPKTVNPLTSGKILFHLAMQIIKAALEALRLRPPVLGTAEQFQQLVVDATFVRSWMLRYAGVSPNLARPSDSGTNASVVRSKGSIPPFASGGGDPHTNKKHSLKPTAPVSGNDASHHGNDASGNSETSSPVAVNEQDAQAIHNLVDDWIQSAKACAVDKKLPNQALVDRVVFDAWMSAYFGYDTSG
ncbi:hypothetical protein EV178_004544 [Coemansia sp. RSA 1646]|nr:hypothetical protein EV178_004544 [Coemansia sp. RSA 1646]KAJ2090098.1 hypothetical protein IW138_002908 [Coemansia sp. RSA 986]